MTQEVEPAELDAAGAKAKDLEIVVCVTCGSTKTGEPSRGQRLFERVRARAAEPIRVAQTRCLMACSRGNTALLRVAGKYGYVLGELQPSDEHADALIRYAELVADSERGVVAYGQWPEAVRGHFVCRIPPVEEKGRC